jgi:hypothetical protein
MLQIVLFFLSPGFMPIIISRIFKFFKLKQVWVTYMLTFLHASFVIVTFFNVMGEEKSQVFWKYIITALTVVTLIAFSLLIQWYFNKLWFVGEDE